MPERDELLRSGREAYVRKEWSAASRDFLAASRYGPLPTVDLDALATATWWSGNVPGSLSVAEETYRHLVSDGDRAGAAMTAIELALRWATLGDTAVASGWLNRARRILGGLEDSPAYGYLMYLEASMSLDFEGKSEGAAEASAALDALSVTARDPAMACFARVLSGMALVREGRTEAGFSELDEAMLPVLAGDVPPEWAGDIYCTVTHLCHVLADYGRMRSWTEALERWTATMSPTFTYAHVTRVHELQLMAVEGGWGAVAQEIGPLSDRLASAHAWMAGAGYYELGEVRRLRGDSAGAQAAFNRVRDVGMDPQPGEALLRLAEGHRSEALERLSIALAEAGPLDRARLLLPATELALAAGRKDRAAGYSQELEHVAARYASPGFLAWAAHARALVLLAEGQPAQALDAVDAAVRIYREQRARYSIARIHEVSAACRRMMGDQGAADADRATALAIYRQLGAVPDVSRLNDAAPGGLTAREAEILALVCKGASNREVAAALVISEKTVGRHLANIFPKIGVSSRTGAAGWARAHGLS